MKLEGYGCGLFELLFSHLLEGLIKSTKNPNQCRRCRGEDSNNVHSVTSTPACSAQYYPVHQSCNDKYCLQLTVAHLF